MALALGHTDSRYEPHGRVLEPSAARPRASGDVVPRQILARWGAASPPGDVVVIQNMGLDVPQVPSSKQGGS